MSPESAAARLSRLLTMVPWLLRRQGVDLAEAAAEFGVSTAQLESDLELLFLCGTPGGMPDDLIEAEWESGRVYLGNVEGIGRPLRLGVDEALTLAVGLRTLAAVPGLGDREVVDRALAKLEDATSRAGRDVAESAGSRIQVDLAEGAQEHTLGQLRQALDRRRRLQLTYLVPARDEATEREVSPMRVTSVAGHWYLEGWCHRSDDVRLFRLDRIQRVEVLDVDGTPPERARPRDLDAGVFQPRPDDLAVSLSVTPQARWIADYYPHDSVEAAPDGSAVITLRMGDVGWLRRLAWRLGGQARVVAPAWLAQQVADGARAALAGYDEPPSADSDTPYTG